ncbi:MAG TPA: lamin tail domain-containing protein [Spirochaetota bacterium]|nr:lamin tail domain-containing protein [Spirochaetota bacterium]HPH03140.1 lamin tail domain-containing protein [Spirochaetota bacterium]HPN83676.1 lamin tail domain-containing protein [Spirochaetota bacterium]
MNRWLRGIWILGILCSLGRPGYGVYISEVMAHPAGGGGAADEYIEICNPGRETIDLGTCLLATPGGKRQALIPWNGPFSGIPAGILLAPGGIALITAPGYTGRYRDWLSATPHQAGRIHLTIDGSRLAVHGLPNDGGAILLEDGNGKLLDVLVWFEDAGEGTSWERGPGPSAPLVRRYHGGTPGSAAVPLFELTKKPERFVLEQPVSTRDRPGTAILTLKTGESARICLFTLGGRRIAEVSGQLGGPGVWRIPVPREQEDGRLLPVGRFCLTAEISLENGESIHVTRLLRIAPHHR